MGSMITLGIDKFEIDWGKNDFFINHSKLFQPNDITEIPYYYVDNIVEYKEGFSRKLTDIKRRLELLGYSMRSLRDRYNAHLDSFPVYYDDVTVTYDMFYEVISSLNINNIQLDEEYGDYSLGEFLSRYLFKQAEFNRKINLSELDRHIGTIFENMDPYITLRILMDNEDNIDQKLQWRYADLVEGGWVKKENLFEPLNDGEKILIVTEGSSDSFIIGRALEILYPDIADFFYFVDMEEHYPFTGTGNLYKFCQGLSSIKIQNNVLVIYDNDAAGVAKYNLSKLLLLPKSMQITKLPDHNSFNNFQTIGPNGRSRENINGSAVAIECFLDLEHLTDEEPCIRWTSYDAGMQRYQGELIDKDAYIKVFKKLRTAGSGYNFTKLKFMIDHLYNEWVSNHT
jgi:hypothetical protein